MANYTYEYSNFPNEIIAKHEFKDVDNTIAVLVNTIKSLQSKGLYNEAFELLSDNTSVLNPYIIDASVFNELFEHARNTEIYAMSNRQYIYTDEQEPSTWVDGDIWIGGD